MNTKKATIQNKTLVYFFKKEIDSSLKFKLLKNMSKARGIRTEIWVYRVDDNGAMNLIICS